MRNCQVGYLDIHLFIASVPSVLWRCWLGGRKGIRPVKNLSGGVLAWFSVWSEVQTCIWPSWCHCHSLSLTSVKSRLVLPFWYRLTRVVPEKGPLNGCVCVCVTLHIMPCYTHKMAIVYWDHRFRDVTSPCVYRYQQQDWHCINAAESIAQSIQAGF